MLLLILLPLTLLGALGFMILGPIITEKKPGFLYLGVRFNDERSVQFIDKNITNPLTTLAFFPGDADSVPEEPTLQYDNLRRGKNIVDISSLDDGIYLLRFSCEGYSPLVVRMEKVGGDFMDTPAKQVPEGSRVLDQFVGVTLQDRQEP